MSRSYKYPIFKDLPDKFYKRLSNKKIRKFLKTLEKGFKSTKLFKELVNKWDICDYKWYPEDEEKLKIARRK